MQRELTNEELEPLFRLMSWIKANDPSFDWTTATHVVPAFFAGISVALYHPDVANELIEAGSLEAQEDGLRTAAFIALGEDK